MSSLVIVESPAKAKTINKILGKTFVVKASVGHVKDLPASKLGVDVKNNFEPEYIVIPGKESVIKDLKSAAKKADKIYLAPDPDREGEAIAFHIASELSTKKDAPDRIMRVTFNEITEKAVKDAFNNPSNIDMNKVDAQQARRILDRLVGYSLSPLLWKKVRRGLSAGRVQSVAVRLVVDREREILAFNKEEYWSITVEFLGSELPKFKARLFKVDGRLVIDRDAETGKQFLIRDTNEATRIATDIQTKSFKLSSIDKRQRKRQSAPPFITSTLQQEASRKLRFPAKKTMQIAQMLYEGIELGSEGAHGLITYMRTDSVRVAKEAQDWARELIVKTYGKEYIPENPPFFKSKQSAQEAHEAVRPTSGEYPPQNIKHYLSKDQYNLYKLIWNRFMASQMSPAIVDQTTFIVESAPYELRASGSVIRFNGFMALYTETIDDIEEEEGGILPSLQEGEGLKLHETIPAQHSTQPPPRYSEATIVKTLEEKGIGRPSTYATIISTISDRKYVLKEEGRFAPTELGMLVNDLLVDKFPELMDFGFTATLEDELDQIEEGKLKWPKVVNDFYEPFDKDLNDALATLGRVKPEDIATDEVCDKCGKPMLIKWGRHGRFMACSGYPECKNTKPLESERNELPAELSEEKCPNCGKDMVMKIGKFGKFLACSGYPECKTAKAIATGVKCPLDGGDIVERRSKRGKFWSCGNYPNCKFALWYKPVIEKCPNCGCEFLMEKRDKSGTVTMICHDKKCGYKREVKSEEA